MANACNHRNVILQIVDRDLCSGCGVCAGVCPGHFLSLAHASNGDLVARWTDAPCNTNCGLCLAVCPFAHGVHNPRLLNAKSFGPESGQAPTRHFHDDVGFYSTAYVGYSETHRPTSASGGLLTWTVEQLLATGQVDRVAVVLFQPDESQRVRFTFTEARTAAEVQEAAGSVYHQVDVSDILRRIAAQPGLRWAITGVPCLCTAIRLAMLHQPSLHRSVRYLLGLACGMYQNTFYTQLLLAASGVCRDSVTRIEFRRKAENRAPSDYLFRGTDDCGPGSEVSYQGLPCYLGRNAFFRLNACNHCMDVFAENADACFMDAWLPEYRNEPRGTSLVLVRSQALQDALARGESHPGVCLREIDIDRVIASQRGHVRRKRYLIDMRVGKRVDRSTGRPFSLSDRIAWFVQRYAQRRSKIEWAQAGHNPRLRAFWRALWDVQALIALETLCDATLGRAMRVLARFRR